LVSRRLIADGHTAVIVDESYSSSEIRGHRGDPANVQTLKDAGLSQTSTVIVATANDRRNLLIAQLARAHFDVSRTIVLVNHPDRYEPLADAGHQTVCATTVLTDAIVGDL
jgi:Trk K+ transport system NAD-binding subunit